MSERPNNLRSLVGDGNVNKPTPEDVFSGKINVYLVDADLDRRVLVLRAVRDLLRGLGRPAARFTEAGEFLARFEGGQRPLLVGWADSRDEARALAARVQADSQHSVTIGLGLSDDEVEEFAAEHAETESAGRNDAEPMPHLPLIDPSDEAEEGWTPDAATARLALVILAQHGGTPLTALAWTKVMAEASDDSIFDEVATLFRSSFPLVGGER